MNWYHNYIVSSVVNDKITKKAGIMDWVLWGAMLTMGVGGLSEAEAAQAVKTTPQEIQQKLQNFRPLVETEFLKNQNDVAKIQKKIKGNGDIVMNAEDAVARTLYAEAKGEGKEGLDAVASAIWNRAKGNVGLLIPVVRARKQFSCWNESTPSRGKDKEPIWEYCKKISKDMVNGQFHSTHKYKSYLNLNKFNLKHPPPSWAVKNGVVAPDHIEIGRHTFLVPYAGEKVKTPHKHARR